MKQISGKAAGFIRTWWKKVLICGIAALLLAAGLEELQLLTQPKTYAYEEKSAENEVSLPLEEAYLLNCTLEDGKITVEDTGEICFELQESGSFNRVTLFLDPAPTEGSIRVMYAPADWILSEEENSYELQYTTGMERVDFTFDADSYGKIGLILKGSLRVKEIRTSRAEYERVPIKERFSLRRLAMLSVMLFAAAMFLFGIHGWKRFRGCVQQAITGVSENPRKTLLNTALFFAAAALCYAGVRIYVTYWYEKFTWVLNVFCILAAIAAGCLACFRKTLGRKPEVFFLIICLLIGSQLAIFEPDTTTISWDDGFHYMSASNYSFLGQTRLTEQENVVLTAWAERNYDLNSLDGWHGQQDELYRQGVVTLAQGMPNPKNFWSLFSGIGLYAARVLGFPFHRIWEMGRLFNLLAYAIVGYFAIRRLKSGKMILAAVLLIPECVFLASNYSYDPGVTGFLALGLSYCFAEWQEPEKKLTPFNACVILGSLFLGSYTKGVYFPVFLIPMFLPKDKFESRTWRRVFLCAAAIVMLYVMYDVASPFLGGNATGATDTRGGSDVDAGRQMQFIFANPLYYTGVLLRSLWTVIGPEYADGLLSYFAYLGKTPNQYLYLILLAVVAFTDKCEADRELGRRIWTRGFFQFLLFGIACLVGTSMYVVFTKVGAYGIEGFQYRYVLPVVYPAMMLLGSGRIRNETNRALYNGILFAVIAYVNFSAVLSSVMSLYS